jgi:hypothetical protein
MTYDDWRRERACENKIRFKKEAWARTAARDSAVTYQEPYEAWAAYECPRCLRWHIGHKPGWGQVSKDGRKAE